MKHRREHSMDRSWVWSSNIGLSVLQLRFSGDYHSFFFFFQPHNATASFCYLASDCACHHEFFSLFINSCIGVWLYSKWHGGSVALGSSSGYLSCEGPLAGEDSPGALGATSMSKADFTFLLNLLRLRETRELNTAWGMELLRAGRRALYFVVFIYLISQFFTTGNNERYRKERPCVSCLSRFVGQCSLSQTHH